MITTYGTGTASARFEGSGGLYMLKTDYFDENDGKASARTAALAVNSLEGEFDVYGYSSVEGLRKIGHFE